MTDYLAMHAFHELMNRGPHPGEAYGVLPEGNRPGYGEDAFMHPGPLDYRIKRRRLYGYDL